MRRAVLAVLLCLPTAIHAQTDLRAELTETFAPMNEVENVAETLSCVALYRSLSLVFGPESDLFAGFQSREGFMASVAGVLWVASEGVEGQTTDEVFAVLLPPIDAATDQYLAYMDAVAEQTDAPFDDVILDQVDFCNAIYEALQQDAD